MTNLYQRLVMAKPLLTLLLLALVIFAAVTQLAKIRLDASSDSLLLQGDPDLAFFREAASHYDSSEFLVLTWRPDGPLLAPDSLEPLAALADELKRVDGVHSVTTLLDVPLLESPPLGLTDLASADAMPTLRNPDVSRELALTEFTTSPIYRNLLVSESGEVTAIQVTLVPDVEAEHLLKRREELRAMAAAGPLGQDDQIELSEVEQAYDQASARYSENRGRLVADVRGVAERFRPYAQIFVGGVPMIAADMLDFVQADLETFGAAIILIMSLILALIFRGWRWVLIPIINCAATATFMLGLLGWFDWRMTVISSNFVAVLLIITLSLSIHLVVRYRELEHTDPDMTRAQRALRSVELMVVPCLYTALTTVVAFVSLVVSGLQPVIDFGWMMTVGICVGFVFTFTIVPTLMALLPQGRVAPAEDDVSFTRHLSAVVEHRGGVIIAVSALIIVATAVGLKLLQVENRFIDYFKESTEIYQGMELLDAELGGTIPLDIILRAPEGTEGPQPVADVVSETAEPDANDDFFGDDPFADEGDVFAAEGTASTSYWFTVQGREVIDRVHHLVDEREASGKVLSLSTTYEVLDGLFGDRLGSVELALMENSMPSDVQTTLVDPYFNAEFDEARITVRARETSENLRRDQFLKALQASIENDVGLAPEQFRLTGLLVLYNNVLQSLFKSQILTLGVVFLAIGLMFWVLFRSLSLAMLALAPNLLAAGLVLGMMGLAGIPLDIMTITIAAIVVGIGVDDCIHYIHRFRVEFEVDGDYHAAMHRSHGSIGRAMFYTTLTIVVGFSLLTLSNFTPSIYFGVLTVVAMIAAVAGALLLLPKLLLMFKPLGPDRQAA